MVLENAGMIVSIVHSSAVRRQNLAYVDLIEWLRDLQSNMNQFDDVARQVIYEEMFKDVDVTPEESAMAEIERRLWNKRETKRIDLFLRSNILLWNEPRRSIRELFINTLIPDFEIQKVYFAPFNLKAFGLRFAMNYVRLADSFLLHDQFPDLNLIHMSLEFFRGPGAVILLNETEMFQIVCDFLVYDYINLMSLYKRVYYVSDIIKDKKYLYKMASAFDPESKAILTTIGQGTNTWEILGRFEYLVTSDCARECFQIVNTHSRANFQAFLNLCSVFQDIDPEVRRTVTHVEYERESWASVFALLQECMNVRVTP
jgi:hypothetical protein